MSTPNVSIAPPTFYRIGNATLDLVPRSDHPRDGRGVLWMWEPPDPRATYVIGADPAMGVPGWSRFLPSKVPNDNCAFCVTRVGVNGRPDVQVAEYAAPLDAEDFASPLAAAGRIYSGAAESGEAMVIIEVQPGPGLATQRRMIDHYGYTNFFHWQYLDQFNPVPTKWLGFVSSAQSVRLLWLRAHNHIARGMFIPRSPYLIEEMRYTIINPQMWGEATSGRKDDRIRAAMLSIWGAHSWTMQLEIPQPKVETSAKPALWQASDISSERLMEEWEQRFIEIQDAP